MNSKIFQHIDLYSKSEQISQTIHIFINILCRFTSFQFISFNLLSTIMFKNTQLDHYKCILAQQTYPIFRQTFLMSKQNTEQSKISEHQQYKSLQNNIKQKTASRNNQTRLLLLLLRRQNSNFDKINSIIGINYNRYLKCLEGMYMRAVYYLEHLYQKLNKGKFQYFTFRRMKKLVSMLMNWKQNDSQSLGLVRKHLQSVLRFLILDQPTTEQQLISTIQILHKSIKQTFPNPVQENLKFEPIDIIPKKQQNQFKNLKPYARFTNTVEKIQSKTNKDQWIEDQQFFLEDSQDKKIVEFAQYYDDQSYSNNTEQEHKEEEKKEDIMEKHNEQSVIDKEVQKPLVILKKTRPPLEEWTRQQQDILVKFYLEIPKHRVTRAYQKLRQYFPNSQKFSRSRTLSKLITLFRNGIAALKNQLQNKQLLQNFPPVSTYTSKIVIQTKDKAMPQPIKSKILQLTNNCELSQTILQDIASRLIEVMKKRKKYERRSEIVNYYLKKNLEEQVKQEIKQQVQQ